MRKIVLSSLILSLVLIVVSCGGEDGEQVSQDTPVIPLSECSDCHAEPQGTIRQILENTGDGLGDFAMNSHHVMGSVQRSDCETCHYLGTHGDGVVKLHDPDVGVGQIYVYDSSDPSGIEGFCLRCHDDDGATAGFGLAPFSDGIEVPPVDGSLWGAAAHRARGYSLNGGRPLTCLGDGLSSGCHGNGHGSDNIRLLNLAAGSSLEDLCFNCHTDGGVKNDALAGPVNDIAEAFGQSEKHDLGTIFTVGSDTFTLQCTTCHNPHVVTGRHWDGDAVITPITSPDFSDSTNNPRAMGPEPWGDEPGEKMADFAAQGTGTGGWYYSVARGGLTVLDQPAVYQPPKTGSGYSFEFSGNILADYATFCLDCHSYKMGAAVSEVNWGQGGITCSYSGAPDQWVTCNSPHGLDMAARPSFWGTSQGLFGSNENPDPIFDQPGVARGRSAGHFMRWPYDSVHKNAGINFVMSCTDCHEAHGSGVGSLLRDQVNNGPGSVIWNTMCNNCHYYYGGHHAGMSCGNASCHGANSIHRIDRNSGGGGAYLWAEPSRPTSTPEIVSVTGDVSSVQLTVVFTEGVWTEMDQTGALTEEDLLLTDLNGDNPRTITTVTHTAGSSTAFLTMSAPLIASDAGSDIVATRGISVWDADGDPAGPWPVVISTP